MENEKVELQGHAKAYGFQNSVELAKVAIRKLESPLKGQPAEPH
jgi:hypothetical protein